MIKANCLTCAKVEHTSFDRETAYDRMSNCFCDCATPNPHRREVTRLRVLRETGQTAHNHVTQEGSVHGLIAQKRRAGVLATAPGPTPRSSRLNP
jgi:hypothetical protein